MDFCHLDQSICIKHNQPFVLANSDQKLGSLCIVCLQQLPDNTITQQFDQLYEKANKEIYEDSELFEQLLSQLLKQKEEITSQLNNIVQLLENQLHFIKDLKLKMNSITCSDFSYQTRIIDLKEVSRQRLQVKIDVKDQLIKLNNFFSYKTLDIEKLDSILENSLMNENVNQLKKFQYELIEDSTIKFEQTCNALAFNKDNSILAVAINKSLILYEFVNGRIVKELQRLDNQSNETEYCLYFMKKSNSFISGGHNKLITIWTFDEINNKWIVKNMLKEHDALITCILMNKMEDKLISGSFDCKLKIWRLKNESWKCFQSISTKYRIWDMCLNEVEDKLILCENNCKILPQKQCIEILLQQKNEKWNVIQKIKYIELGWRLSFTIGDQFIFATCPSEYLDIYDFNTDKQQFEKVSQIQVPNILECGYSFPCQFIKSLNILIFKRGQQVNVIKMNEMKKLEIVQTIEFHNFHVQGRITDDGQYLVICDDACREIQIRKIKFL